MCSANGFETSTPSLVAAAAIASSATLPLWLGLSFTGTYVPMRRMWPNKT